MRNLRQTLTLQARTVTDDGLEPVSTWTDDETLAATVAPIGRADRERAGINVDVAAFTIKVPKGFAVDPQNNRFMNSAGDTWRVLDVLEAPSVTLVTVEAVS